MRVSLGVAVVGAVTVVATAFGGCTPIPASPRPASAEPAATVQPTAAGPASTSASPTTQPGTPLPTAPLPTTRPTGTAGLRDSFPQFAARQRGELALAVAPVGTGTEPEVFGELGDPVAWSTIKVPISIAVDNTDHGVRLRRTMRQAITASDNDAATQLWQVLGDGSTAATKTDRVLRDFGDPTTTTQARQVRPPYTPFGQTQWTLADQTRFAAQLPCHREAAAVYAAMGEIIAEQSWGLGQLPSAHFKGGWGPSSTGYLVRQFGVIETPRGQVAVAIAVDAPNFDQGTATLTRTAQWLGEQVDALPAGSC